uniref:Uncharacterized protein n=1 Tax=Auxenochlorella protothecoides TaxID=3075 RepID=A0A1D2AF90_AUXPR
MAGQQDWAYCAGSIEKHVAHTAYQRFVPRLSRAQQSRCDVGWPTAHPIRSPPPTMHPQPRRTAWLPARWRPPPPRLPAAACCVVCAPTAPSRWTRRWSPPGSAATGCRPGCCSAPAAAPAPCRASWRAPASWRRTAALSWGRSRRTGLRAMRWTSWPWRACWARRGRRQGAQGSCSMPRSSACRPSRRNCSGTMWARQRLPTKTSSAIFPELCAVESGGMGVPHWRPGQLLPAGYGPSGPAAFGGALGKEPMSPKDCAGGAPNPASSLILEPGTCIRHLVRLIPHYFPVPSRSPSGLPMGTQRDVSTQAGDVGPLGAAVTELLVSSHARLPVLLQAVEDVQQPGICAPTLR